MAGNNSFMTTLLALLDDDKYTNDVPSQPPSSMELVDVKYYLSVIEEILDAATAVAENTQPKGNQVQSKSSTLTSKGISASLSSTINELCCQITCKAQHTNDVRQTMESLLGQLSAFSWDAKAVLTLLALTVHYAEKWHLAQIEESDVLFRLTGILKGSLVIGKSLNTQQRAEAFMVFNYLIRDTLKFTRYIVENDSKGFREFAASISISGYFKFIIVIVLGCSVQFSGMISTGNEFLELDLSPFFNRVTKRYEVFMEYVKIYERENEKLQYKRIKELYRSPAGILKLVAEMFCTEKDSPTVYHCIKKTTVKVEELQSKNVMLLISELNLSNDDFAMLTAIYKASAFKSSNYEILWVPIVDEKDREQFLKKRSQMTWYSCNSIVSKAAAKFIRKHWQFKQQTKLVVLNPEGKLVNMEAMAMIRLWQSEAFPPTSQRGWALWEKHRNNWLKLVVDTDLSWEMKPLIFLCGSAEDSKIVEQIDDILNSKLAAYNIKFLNINTKRKQFLSRLESCIAWKMQANKEMPDPLTLELLELYTSYKKQSGFAIVARGSSVIVNTTLTDLWKVLSEHRLWIKKDTNRDNFETHFQAYYKAVILMPQCYQFSIPDMVGDIPECIKCPTTNCTRKMETVVTFKCCHGAH
ncbi:protein SIEVE ELEMENT OCCLUSION B-like [Rhodamnia argentea]|uniref:Protein SIEVE ELEMENT OCCLUSION B-like n=1 Tax=Rhodamnia argentea TaxID=178133 RepID=A0ABM3HAH4_9MYRT|nr:protein SIEVE ELEMENT OCCLUSION B-like [Rhodamnia argentea]